MPERCAARRVQHSAASAATFVCGNWGLIHRRLHSGGVGAHVNAHPAHSRARHRLLPCRDRAIAEPRRQPFGRRRFSTAKGLHQAGIAEKRRPAVRIQITELRQILQNRPELDAITGEQAHCGFDRLQIAERREFIDYGQGTLIHAPLAYHWARMIELLHTAETIKDLLHDDDLSTGELGHSGKRHHSGVGVIEAPRGTLIHHYRVDDDDLVTMCNLIVSTTHNNQPMNEAIRRVARRYLDGRQLSEGLLNHVEVAIRAFDPCLSCATHALGRMPLQIELLDAAGQVIDRLSSPA